MSIKWDDQSAIVTSPTPEPAHTPGTITRRRKLGIIAVSGATILAFVLAYTVGSTVLGGGDLEAIGHAYPHQLGKEYAEAWEEGAKLLDAGQSIEKALGQVHTSWDSRRTTLFEQVVTPKFNAVVSETKPEADITTEDRRSLAKAWREFASGLAK